MAEKIGLQQFATDMSKQPEEVRLQFAKLLKQAGLLKGTPSAKFDIKYYEALTRLEEKYQAQLSLNALLGDATPVGRQDVLVDIITTGDGSGDGTGPKTTSQSYITSPTQTNKILDSIAQDLLDRKMTKAEKAKYAALINKAQKEQPAVQTTGKNYSVTRGGVDEEQLVREKISQTGEAKDKRMTDAYAVMLEELGGLR